MDPSLDGWVMSHRADKLVIDARTEGHTDRRSQRQYPQATQLSSGNKTKKNAVYIDENVKS